MSVSKAVVVGVGALMTCVGMGAMMSLAVYLQPISETTGWSRAGVSATATLPTLRSSTRAPCSASQMLRLRRGVTLSP